MQRREKMTWFPRKKVIVPVDLSDQSLAAIDIGLQLVDTPSHLTVVLALQELQAAEPAALWGTVDKDTRTRHAAQAVRERLEDDKYKEIQIEILFGDPGSEVAKLAEQQDAELIVLPSHGRTGIKRLLIGSVAERVARLAHCPVLILRD
jgi:nucleotide-binding universal stress UspA family protein